MRILVVSRHFHHTVETMVHGVFKRFQMFLEAISEIAQIDLLYYVSPQTNTCPSAVAKFELSISNHFQVPVRLFLCPMTPGKDFFSKITGYLKGSVSIIYQPEYSSTSGSVQLNAFETCLDKNPDAILVHRLGAMVPLFLTRKKLPPVFFDQDDIEHVAIKRRLLRFPDIRTTLLKLMLFPALYRGEHKAIQLAHRTFICSDNDLDYLTNKWQPEGLVKIPNSVPIPGAQKITSAPNLLFLGSYSHRPNIDAAEFLIRKIWPVVHKEVPSAKLVIAGTFPEKISCFPIGAAGVQFAGFVKDLEDLYQHTRVVCAPILSGSGTRVKILEAAAYGKPVVSTQIGAEGLEMREDIDIIIRDDPKAFAKACIRLLNDMDKCNEIGNAARTTVMKIYDKEKIKKKINKTILESL